VHFFCIAANVAIKTIIDQSHGPAKG